MAQCRYPDCGWDVDFEWAYCAHCGRSQTQERRPRPVACEHEFDIAGPHCVRCGESFEDDRQPKWVGIGVTAVGIVMLFGCGALLALGKDKGLVRLASEIAPVAVIVIGIGAKLLIPSHR